MRVLIVEDEPLLAGAIRDGLRLEAIAADVAGDGDTALELLAVNAYDIAVLDRDIPGPSGDEVARHVVASGSGVPILMLTAADRLDDKASGFELGADDYLTKPFEMRELVLRLRALDRRRGHNRPPVRELADRLRAAQAPRPAVDHRDGRRRRLPDRHRAAGVTPSSARAPGPSVRLQLALSYVGFLMVAGALLLVVVYVFLLRYVPDEVTTLGPYSPNRGDLERAFLPRALQALGVLLVVGLVGGWLLAGRMLAPLTRLTHATHLAADGSLSHLIRMEGRADEFRQLADDFDTMLARLEAHDAEQQRFAANASHELRTPLAITQALLDVARQDPARGRDDLVDQLHAVNVRAIDLTEALLLLSRSDRRAFTREPVDLSLAAEEAAEALLPLAEARGVTVEVVGEVAEAVGSHALLLQLTTNLVHNAIVHNHPDGTVTVTTRARPTGVELEVDNTGAVLTRAVVATLTEPFQRGTGRVRTDHAGVGLGLAIVRSIAEAHGGSLDLAPRDGGGLRVVVRLPAASG